MARATILIKDPRYLARPQRGPVYIPRTSRRDAIVLRPSAGRPNTVWLGLSAFAIAAAMAGALNLPSSRSTAPSFSFSRADSIIFKTPERVAVQRFAEEQADLGGVSEDGFNFSNRWVLVADDGPMGPAAYGEPEYTGALGYAPVRTVRYSKAGSGGGFQLASADPSGGIESFPSILSDAATEKAERIARLRQEMMNDPAAQAALGKMDEVERYLWEVYTRQPIKKDGAGDFTWKDPAAAKRLGMALPTYVISGMDPDFREQLYHAGRAMDADGVHWGILSAFRDDYRQRLASGFKASPKNSLHGGSVRTGGYGHGRAVDVTSADGDMEDVWRWIDKHGAKYGLTRPMPGADPAHIQSRGDWRALAHNLKAGRLKTEQASVTTEQTRTADAKTSKRKRVANASK